MISALEISVNYGIRSELITLFDYIEQQTFSSHGAERKSLRE